MIARSRNLVRGRSTWLPLHSRGRGHNVSATLEAPIPTR